MGTDLRRQSFILRVACARKVYAVMLVQRPLRTTCGNCNDTMPNPTYVTPTLHATFEPLDKRLLADAQSNEPAFVITDAVQQRVQTITSGVTPQRVLAPADAGALMRSHAREFLKNGERDKANMALIVADRAESRATFLLMRGE